MKYTMTGASVLAVMLAVSSVHAAETEAAEAESHREAGWAARVLDSGILGAEASVDLASSYVFRGQTLNDGMTLQPDAALRVWLFSVGVWANMDIDDDQKSVESYQVSETRLYADCEARFRKLRLGARYTKYLERLTHAQNMRNRLRNGDLSPAERTTIEDFLTAAGEPTEVAEEANEDDAEASAWLSYGEVVRPSVAVHRGLSGTIEEQTYLEAGLAWTYFDRGGWVMDVGANVAYIEQPEGVSGWSHARFTHTVTWKMIRASFNYIQSIDEDLLVESRDGGPYDIRNYGTIGVFHAF